MVKKIVVQCDNVWKIYNQGTRAEVNALRGVNLKIKEGQFVSIEGASGSGKSTLLNCIGCLDTPTKGKVFFEGDDISKMGEDELALIRREKIGFVFQTFNIIPTLTALQNVELPMIFSGVGEGKRKRRAKKLLESVGLGGRIEHRPTELSGGERQRVAISRALANDPSIILADEPTGNLDSKTGKDIIEIFKELNKKGRTIVVITHDRAISKHAKDVLKFKDGKILD